MRIPTSPWITRRGLLRAAAIGAAAGLPGLANAQAAFPVKPLRLVVPYPHKYEAANMGRFISTQQGMKLD